MVHRPDRVLLTEDIENGLWMSCPSRPAKHSSWVLTFHMSNALRQARQSEQHDVTLSRGWSEPLLGGQSSQLWALSIVFFKDMMQKAVIHCAFMKGYRICMPMKKRSFNVSAIETVLKGYMFG